MHFQYKITISVVIYRSKKWKCQLMMTNPIINRQDSITSIGMTPYHKSNFKILIFDLDSLYLIHKTSFAPFRKQDKYLIDAYFEINGNEQCYFKLKIQMCSVMNWNISDKLKAYCVGCLQCWEKSKGLITLDPIEQKIELKDQK